MSYLNIHEVESGLKALAAAYPQLCSLQTLPQASIEGRPVYALRVGKGNRPVFLVTGCAHAREWGSAEICIGLAADLLAVFQNGGGLQYGGKRFYGGELARLLDGMDWLFVPLVNPDGRLYSQTVEAMWRRNRNPLGGHGHRMCEGVDLNRNYDFLWDFERYFHPDSGIGTSSDPCDPSQTYRGPAPLSEPECQNVAGLLTGLMELRWYVDLHSYGQLILFPWGNDESQSENGGMSYRNPAWDHRRGLAGDGYREFIPKADAQVFSRLAEAMAGAIRSVRGTRYSPQSSFELYPTSGTADDYAYSLDRNPKILAFTVEWGQTFQPPWSEMEQIVADVSAGLIGLGLACLDELARTTPHIKLLTPDLVFVPHRSKQVRLEVTSAMDVELIPEVPAGWFAKSRVIKGHPGMRSVRLTVQHQGGAAGELILRCPQTGQELGVKLSLA